MITKEDLLQIRLQDYVRPILKQRIAEQKIRKIVLSEILEDALIKNLLKNGKFEETKNLALDIAESFQDKNPIHKEA